MKAIAKSVIGLAVLLGAGVAGDARAQVCTNTPLPEVSAAVIPANGFPLYTAADRTGSAPARSWGRRRPHPAAASRSGCATGGERDRQGGAAGLRA